MTCNLLNTNDDYRILNKNFTQIASVECQINFKISETQPEFILSVTNNFNYIFYNNKYYYVTDKKIDKNKMIVSTIIDTLSTYKNNLLNCFVLAKRTGNKSGIENDTNVLINTNQVWYDVQKIGELTNNLNNKRYVGGIL